MRNKNNDDDLGVDHFATLDDRLRKRQQRVEEVVKAGQWGNWRFDSNHKLLIINKSLNDMPPFDIYEVDLEECNSSAQILDWIAQVSQKTWASREDIGYLVEALEEILCLQGSFCGRGKEMSDGKADYASKIIDSLIRTAEKDK